MKKFENTQIYFVLLRGTGNPDFRQYSDIAPTQIAHVDSFEEAVQVCQKFIIDWELGGGNWTGSFPGDVCRAGNVFDLDGNLVKYISYNGRLWEPEAAQQWQQNHWEVQFDSYNRWQVNRLEALLQQIGAEDIISEPWIGSLIERDLPEIHTFCKIRDMTVNQIFDVAKQASPYIHVTHVGVRTRLNLKTKLLEMEV